jgi:hypothetical protein
MQAPNVEVPTQLFHEGIDAVEKLCDWIEPQWRRGPKKVVGARGLEPLTSCV